MSVRWAVLDSPVRSSFLELDRLVVTIPWLKKRLLYIECLCVFYLYGSVYLIPSLT